MDYGTSPMYDLQLKQYSANNTKTQHTITVLQMMGL